MIIKIKDILNNIIDEDYISDKQSRELANDAYERVLETLNTFRALKSQGGMWQPCEEERSSGIHLYGILLKLEPEDINIIISSPHKKEVSTGGHWSASMRTIWINPHRDIDTDAFWDNGFNFEEYASRVLYDFKRSDIKTTFIHEYTHYLDFLRYKDPQAVYKKYISYAKPSEDKDNASNYKKYATQPVEYNAFYQSFMDEVEKDLSNKSLQRQLSIFERYYNFRGYITTFFDSLYDKYKFTDLRERLNKRLYKFYSEHKKELLNIEDNIEPFIVKEVKKFFNKKSQAYISYNLRSFSSKHENSLISLISSIGTEIATIKNYISENKDFEKYYNFKYVELICEIAKEYYPELSEQIDNGLKGWYDETGYGSDKNSGDLNV